MSARSSTLHLRIDPNNPFVDCVPPGIGDLDRECLIRRFPNIGPLLDVFLNDLAIAYAVRRNQGFVHLTCPQGMENLGADYWFKTDHGEHFIPTSYHPGATMEKTTDEDRRKAELEGTVISTSSNSAGVTFTFAPTSVQGRLDVTEKTLSEFMRIANSLIVDQRMVVLAREFEEHLIKVKAAPLPLSF